ncbi:MAG: gamma-glutamylcyclotransferase [Gemmatimonadetes bacterium]|nr:gamma-glutamylcyclotransferase [Gemmatimonadota bacterium]
MKERVRGTDADGTGSAYADGTGSAYASGAGSPAFNLFVYGTLRGGGGRARGKVSGAAGNGNGAGHLSGCEKIADGTIGGTLYNIEGRFPALVYYGADPVHGEVWRCPADLLPSLDAYESTATSLFRRIAVEAETDAGDVLPCWAYAAGPALSRQLTQKNRVTTGSWTPGART